MREAIDRVLEIVGDIDRAEIRIAIEQCNFDVDAATGPSSQHVIWFASLISCSQPCFLELPTKQGRPFSTNLC